jgi:protein HOOK3
LGELEPDLLRVAQFLVLSDLRASLSGKDVPEDIKTRLLNLHEENVGLREQLKTNHEKLSKAKAVRDGLFALTCPNISS